MAIKKVKLNYMSAVSRKPPVAKIKVSSEKMEELNRAVKEKIRQNESNYNAWRANLKDDIYR